MKAKKWSIWRANLDPVIGSDQGKVRPVLIFSEDSINVLLNTVNIIPITSRKTDRTIYPNETLLPSGTAGLNAESVLLCHQIRTIDKRRLNLLYGSLDNLQIQESITEAISFQLGLLP